MTLQLQSLVRADGEVEISLVEVPLPAPGANEVLVRIEAAPINPSDLGVLLARADVATAERRGDRVLARVPTVAGLAARLGTPVPVGNEGAGVVVAAGAAAQELLGKTVGIYGGGMYAQHRIVAAAQCLVLPEGTTAAHGASNFVNPMTTLAMLEAMRREGHTALVHTAAASNLGQMLVKLCAADGVPLVNVVRRPEQVALLRELGAEYVCDSSSATFEQDLTEAIAQTGATLGFDAVGGGRLAGQVLASMEAAASRSAAGYSPYGSTVHKQMYLYGALDRGVTELARNYGMAWGIGGFLVGNLLATLPPADVARLRQRVGSELRTTFASHYTEEISLAGALDLDVMKRYAKQATGEKFLIVPSRVD